MLIKRPLGRFIRLCVLYSPPLISDSQCEQVHHRIEPPALFRRGFRAGQGSSMPRTLSEVASIRETHQYRGLQSQKASPGAPRAPWDHNALKIGESLGAVWIAVFALGPRCESQGGPELFVINYHDYELPSKDPGPVCAPHGPL